ncbi:hypothetical protein [Streptomyces sp. NPDC058579]|uniref:hypothetical protein n=1 Tax=Streptomyces sp. NPDC058579 TaxID=3346548 RepID=UPI0036554B20
MDDVLHPAGGGLFDRLDADWAVLCADPAVLRAVAGWVADACLTDTVAADVWAGSPSPAQFLAVFGPGADGVSGGLADAVLRVLLQCAAGRDWSAALAGRIVVQVMLPAVVRMVRGQVRAAGGRTRDAVGYVAVAALYEVARCGRVHLRPGRPAANLALDTLRRLLAELAAEHGSAGVDLSAAECVADPAPGPFEIARARTVLAAALAAGLHVGPAGDTESLPARVELLELLLDAVRDGALSTVEARVLAWHHISGAIPDADAAARAGATAGAWQRRRSRALARVRPVLLADVALGEPALEHLSVGVRGEVPGAVGVALQPGEEVRVAVRPALKDALLLGPDLCLDLPVDGDGRLPAHLVVEVAQVGAP